MRRRNVPFEEWEWSAIRKNAGSLNPRVVAVLPGLMQANALAHRCELAWSHRLNARKMGQTSNRDAPFCRIGASRLEHRLYTLFAE